MQFIKSLNEKSFHMEEKLNTGDTIAPKNGFFAWLDNFWYHYKWHSLISLFLVFMITVCTLQMCSKESYDIQILYAGPHSFSRQSVDADTPEYLKARQSLARFSSDYDDDGAVKVSFRDLFVPDNDSMGDLAESEYSRAYEDRTNLGTLMVSGNHYLCFISSEVYENYKGTGRFVNLKALVGDDADVEYFDDTGEGIYLSSTDFSSLSGFSDLPEGTLIVLRSTNFSTHLNKRSNEETYKKAEETLLKILKYSAN